MLHYPAIRTNEAALLEELVLKHEQIKDRISYLDEFYGTNVLSSELTKEDIFGIALRMEALYACGQTLDATRSLFINTSVLTAENIAPIGAHLGVRIEDNAPSLSYYQALLTEILNDADYVFSHIDSDSLIEEVCRYFDRSLAGGYTLTVDTRGISLSRGLKTAIARVSVAPALNTGVNNVIIGQSPYAPSIRTSQHLSTEQQSYAQEYQETTSKLRKRPENQGTNDIAHNLTVKYQSCIGIFTDPITKQEKPIMVTQFVKEKNTITLIGKEYTDPAKEGDRPYRELIRPYNEQELYLPAPKTGWIMGETGLYFLEIVAGTYLRGISINNIRPVWFLNDKDTLHNVRFHWGKQLILSVIKKPYFSLTDGLEKKLPYFAANYKVAFLSRKRQEKEKLFVLVNDVCVGEYNFKRNKVKIYKYYHAHKPILEREINHEVE